LAFTTQPFPHAPLRHLAEAPDHRFLARVDDVNPRKEIEGDHQAEHDFAEARMAREMAERGAHVRQRGGARTARQESTYRVPHACQLRKRDACGVLRVTHFVRVVVRIS
jgi:hypothetical protein